MYVDSTKSKSVLFAYTLQPRFREPFMPVKLSGLDPQKTYRLKEINLMPGTKPVFNCHNKMFTGEYLMNVGVAVHSTARDNSFTSSVLEITAE